MGPDNAIPGQVNLFEISDTGAPGYGVASIQTGDNEYPKSGTLHCLWNTPVCYFLTGVARPYTQDYVYAVNRTSGALLYKHTVPNGIYLDNLALDWVTETLYSVAYAPAGQGQPPVARIVSYSGINGGVQILADISRDVDFGFVFPGSVSVCPTTKTMFVGVQSLVADGSFADYFLTYDYSVAPPKLINVNRLGYPIPSATRAVCNQTALLGYLGNYIQSNDAAREVMVLGDLIQPGREGIFIPIAKADLPTFTARGNVPLYLNGMISEFGGLVLIPIFPPFQRGPGPLPNLAGGLLWTWQFPQPGRAPRFALTPLGYYLAGASGVPGR